MTEPDPTPDAAEIRRRIERQLTVDLRRERDRQAISREALTLGGRGIGDFTSTRVRRIELSWSKEARDALPKRGGT